MSSWNRNTCTLLPTPRPAFNLGSELAIRKYIPDIEFIPPPQAESHSRTLYPRTKPASAEADAAKSQSTQNPCQIAALSFFSSFPSNEIASPASQVLVITRLFRSTPSRIENRFRVFVLFFDDYPILLVKRPWPSMTERRAPLDVFALHALPPIRSEAISGDSHDWLVAFRLAPSNIMWTADRSHIKIGDFGVAHLVDLVSTQLTLSAVEPIARPHTSGPFFARQQRTRPPSPLRVVYCAPTPVITAPAVAVISPKRVTSPVEAEPAPIATGTLPRVALSRARLLARVIMHTNDSDDSGTDYSDDDVDEPVELASASTRREALPFPSFHNSCRPAPSSLSRFSVTLHSPTRPPLLSSPLGCSPSPPLSSITRRPSITFPLLRLCPPVFIHFPSSPPPALHPLPLLSCDPLPSALPPLSTPHRLSPASSILHLPPSPAISSLPSLCPAPAAFAFQLPSRPLPSAVAPPRLHHASSQSPRLPPSLHATSHLPRTRLLPLHRSSSSRLFAVLPPMSASIRSPPPPPPDFLHWDSLRTLIHAPLASLPVTLPSPFRSIHFFPLRSPRRYPSPSHFLRSPSLRLHSLLALSPSPATPAPPAFLAPEIAPDGDAPKFRPGGTLRRALACRARRNTCDSAARCARAAGRRDVVLLGCVQSFSEGIFHSCFSVLFY
ncbi:hypothetical protein B0H11DRAFT_2263674 [Mycena galericulata]|nr:hypothetical protein B0H11DRAFT_2263674 [Mycena galericulata]